MIGDVLEFVVFWRSSEESVSRSRKWSLSDVAGQTAEDWDFTIAFGNLEVIGSSSGRGVKAWLEKIHEKMEGEILETVKRENSLKMIGHKGRREMKHQLGWEGILGEGFSEMVWMIMESSNAEGKFADVGEREYP